MRFLRFGVLAIAPVIGFAQTRAYRRPPTRPFIGSPATASPSMMEVGGPEWGFAHGNPAILASFNLADLLKSTVGQWMLVQIARSLSLNAAELEKVIMVLGEIDHVSISAQPGFGRQPDAVVLLTGHFEKQLLARLFQGSGGPAPRMLDSNTMLIGDSASVEGAVQRITTSWNARRTDPLILRARRLTATYDFWISGPPPPEIAGAVGGGLRSFTFGMSFGSQVRIVLALDTTTPQAADRILATYRKLEEAGRRGPKARQWGDITRALQVEKLSPGIQFSVADAAAPPDELLTQLSSIPMFQPLMKSSSIHTALAALDTSNASIQGAAANRKIVISGLDGSKEVPAQ